MYRVLAKPTRYIDTRDSAEHDILENCTIGNMLLVGFVATEVVGKFGLAETVLRSCAGDVGEMEVPERRPQHGTLVHLVLYSLFERGLAPDDHNCPKRGETCLHIAALSAPC